MPSNPGKPKHLRQAREKLQSAKGLYRSMQEVGPGEPGFRQEVLLHAHATVAQAMQEAANAGALGLRDEAYRLQQQIEAHLSRLRGPGRTNPFAQHRGGAEGYMTQGGRGRSFVVASPAEFIEYEHEPEGTVKIIGYAREKKKLKGKGTLRCRFKFITDDLGIVERVKLWEVVGGRRRGGTTKTYTVSNQRYPQDYPQMEEPPTENPCVRRHKDYPTAKRDAARKAKRTDQPYFVYELSKNPRFAVVSGDHPIQQSYEKGIIGLGKAKLRHTANPPTDNPYATKGHATPMGLGLHKDRYTYRGYEIKLVHGKLAGDMVWKAMVSHPSKTTRGVRTQGLAGDVAASRDDVLEWARLYIDHQIYREGLDDPPGYPDTELSKFDNMNDKLWGITYGLAHDGDPVTRSTVARVVEEGRKDDLASWSDHDCDERMAEGDHEDVNSLCFQIWERLLADSYFDSLPLSDRLKWIDSTVKQYRLQHGLPLPNPSKDEKKAKKILKGLTPIPDHITIQRLPPGPVPKKSLMPGEGPRVRGTYMGKSGGRWVRPAAGGPGPHGNPPRKKNAAPKVRKKPADWRPDQSTYAYDLGQWGDGKWIGTVDGIDVLGISRDDAREEADLLRKYGGPTYRMEKVVGRITPEGSVDDWGTHLLLFELLVSDIATFRVEEPYRLSDLAEHVAQEHAFQRKRKGPSGEILDRFASKPRAEQMDMMAEAIRSGHRRGVIGEGRSEAMMVPTRVQLPPGWGSKRRAKKKKKSRPNPESRRAAFRRLMRL